MLCLAVMVIFGFVALAKGEFKITKGRKVSGSMSKILGVLLLIGAGAGLLFGDYGALVQIGAFIIVIIIGLATSEKIDNKEPDQSLPPENQASGD